MINLIIVLVKQGTLTVLFKWSYPFKSSQHVGLGTFKATFPDNSIPCGAASEGVQGSLTSKSQCPVWSLVLDKLRTAETMLFSWHNSICLLPSILTQDVGEFSHAIIFLLFVAQIATCNGGLGFIDSKRVGSFFLR